MTSFSEISESDEDEFIELKTIKNDYYKERFASSMQNWHNMKLFIEYYTDAIKSITSSPFLIYVEFSKQKGVKIEYSSSELNQQALVEINSRVRNLIPNFDYEELSHSVFGPELSLIFELGYNWGIAIKSGRNKFDCFFIRNITSYIGHDTFKDLNSLVNLKSILFEVANPRVGINSSKGKNVKKGILKLKGLLILQTAFLQYWNYFDDYIKTTKGKDLNFNVSKHPQGIEINVEVTEAVREEEIESFLKEYSEYLLAKHIDVKEKFERKALENEVELINLQMREQKHNFERQIDILSTANRILSSDKDRLFLLLESNRSQPIILQLNQSQIQTQSQITTIQIKDTFSDFITDLAPYADQLDIDIEEAELIQEELDEIEVDDPIKLSLYNRLNKFYRSTLNKIKDAKTIIIDAPKVSSALVSGLLRLKNGLMKTGENYESIIQSIREVVGVLGS